MMTPDAALARRMTADMADRLNLALRHLVVDVLERPGWTDLADPSPAAYGLQGMMRDSALAGDLDKVAALFDRLHPVLDPAGEAPGLVSPLSEPHFSAAEVEVLRQGFADDVGLTSLLLPPGPQEAGEATETVSAVLRRLESDAPDWHDEFRALVRRIVLSSAPGGSQPFAGASAFDLWGAILVNPGYRRDPMHLAMTLVHESSHLKLFHAYLDDEIVLNDPEERFSSPLRQEPRPMNGLYHAAYVLARMARFAADMIEADARRAAADGPDPFGPDRLDQFRDEALTAARNFASAHEIIATQGRLTAKGAGIIAEAARAVEGARRVAQAA